MAENIEQYTRELANGYDETLEGLIAIYNKDSSTYDNDGYSRSNVQMWLRGAYHETYVINGTTYHSPYYDKVAYNPYYLFKDMVLGIMTGNVMTNNYGNILPFYEVRLFNPVFNAQGQPCYYIFVRSDEIDAVVNDGTVQGVVWRSFAKRDRYFQADGFPHVDIDYKNVCYDINGILGDYQRTDEYFGNKDWYSYILLKYIHMGYTRNTHPYYGKDYNYRAGKLFEASGDYDSSLQTITPYFAKYDFIKIDMMPFWNGGVLLYTGYVFDKIVENPTVIDVNDNSRVVVNANKIFSLPGMITGLEHDTLYHVRPFAYADGVGYYYGDTMHIRTTSTLSKIKAYMQAGPTTYEDTSLIKKYPYEKTTLSAAFYNKVEYVIQDININAGYPFTKSVITPYEGTAVRYGFRFGRTKETAIEYAPTLVSTEQGKIKGMTLEFSKYNVTLIPGTQYYAAVYIENEAGETLEEDISPWGLYTDITHPKQPFITVATLDSLSKPSSYAVTGYYDKESVILYGVINRKGDKPLSEMGMIYSLNSNTPTLTENNGKILLNKDLLGYQKVTLNNLTPNRIFYARTYLINPDGVFYGDTAMFQTIGIEITNKAVSKITETSVELTFNISLLGMLKYVERGICISTSPNPIRENSIFNEIAENQKLGDFIKSLTGLQPGVKYYVRAYVKSEKILSDKSFYVLDIDSKYFYSNELTFTTTALPAVENEVKLSVYPASSITDTTAVTTFKVDNPSNKIVSETGVAWYLDTNTAVKSQLSDFDGHTIGNALQAVNLGKYAPETKINIKAYAIVNSELILSENTESFTTKKTTVIDPSVPDNPDTPDTPDTPTTDIIPVLSEETGDDLVFPTTNLYIGKTYIFKGTTWYWNGFGWRILPTVVSQASKTQAAQIQAVNTKVASVKQIADTAMRRYDTEEDPTILTDTKDFVKDGDSWITNNKEYVRFQNAWVCFYNNN